MGHIVFSWIFGKRNSGYSNKTHYQLSYLTPVVWNNLPTTTNQIKSKSIYSFT